MKGHSIRKLALGVTAATSVLVMTPGHADTLDARTERVSISTDGTQGNLFTSDVSLSDDGRIVAWDSYGTGFVPEDTNSTEDAFVRDRTTGITELLSVSSDEVQANAGTGRPRVSGDGRFVVFSSDASNLVSGDTNFRRDVFVRDLVAGTTERVSVSSSGEQSNNTSLFANISDDGRHIVFMSDANNFFDGDDNISPDIFVHDRVTGTTDLVSVASNGDPANDGSLYLDISSDGRYVAFSSYASNLSAGDTNERQDVFVHDRETGVTEIASLEVDGSYGARDARYPSVSDDGRFVAFESVSSLLVPADGNGVSDIFVHDRETDRTRRVSVDGAGVEAESGGRPFAPGSYFAAISGDGRYVVFQSESTSLIPDDNDFDVFLHDLRTGATTVPIVTLDGAIPNGGAGLPQIGDDGRFIAYGSGSTNLVPNDTNGWHDAFVTDVGPSTGVGAVHADGTGASLAVSGWTRFAGAVIGTAQDPADDGDAGARDLGAELIGASVAYRPEEASLFVRWELDSAPEITGGAPAVVHALSFVHDATAYELRGLVAGATAVPPASPAFGLFRCDPTCMQIASVDGAYGSTGEEVTALLPLEAAGIDAGATLAGVEAAAGIGEAAAGIVHPLDSIAIGDVMVPMIEVDVGIGPPSQSQVSYDSPATLGDNAFSSLIEMPQPLRGEHRVSARGCMGEVCGIASVVISCPEEGPCARVGESLSPEPTPTETASPTPTESPSPSPSESPPLATTTVTFTERSAESGQYSDETLFEVRLTDSNGDPLSGQELNFELTGAESSRSFSATTDDDGTARVTPTLEEKPGPHQVTVRFAGDEDHAGDADTVSFVVEEEDSALELSVEGEDDDKTLRARLSDLDTSAEGIAQRTIDFYSDGELIESRQTDADGVASEALPPGHRGNNRTYEALFDGDDFYLGSSDERAGKGKGGKGGNDGGDGSAHVDRSHRGAVLLL